MFCVKIRDNEIINSRFIDDENFLEDDEIVCNFTVNEQTKEATLEIPDGVVCMNSINYTPQKTKLDVSKVRVVIPASVEKIKRFGFNLDVPTTVEFAENSNLKLIDDGSFAYCKQLTEIDLPSGLREIGMEAFKLCEKLEKVYIPDGTQYILDEAFRRCSNLKEVRLPESLKDVRADWFDDCPNLSSIILPGGTITCEEIPSDEKEQTDTNQDDVTFYMDALNKFRAAVNEKTQLTVEDFREFVRAIYEKEAKKMGLKCNMIDISNCANDISKTLFEIIEEKYVKRNPNSKSSNTLNVFFDQSIKSGDSEACVDSTDYNQSVHFHFDKVKNIFDNRSGIVAYYCVIVDLLHELQHVRQRLEVQSRVSSHQNMMFCKEYLLLDELTYKEMHDSFSLELDANKKSVDFLRQNFEEPNIGLVGQKIRKIIKVEDGKSVLFEDYVCDFADKHIANEGRVTCLKDGAKFFLYKEYNSDGTKKKISELIDELTGEIKEYAEMEELSDEERKILVDDCKAMYFEILYREMRKYDPSEIKTFGKQYDSKDEYRLFKEMSEYFKIKANSLDREKDLLEPFEESCYDEAKSLLMEKSDYMGSFVPREITDETEK